MKSRTELTAIDVFREEFDIPDNWTYVSTTMAKDEFAKFDNALENKKHTYLQYKTVNDLVEFEMFISPAGMKSLHENWNSNIIL